MDTKNIGFQKQVVKGRSVPRPADPGAEIYRLTLHVSRLDAEVAALRQKVHSLAGDVEAVEEIAENAEAAASQAMAKTTKLETVSKREESFLWESVESLSRRMTDIEEAEDDNETALTHPTRMSMN